MNAVDLTTYKHDGIYDGMKEMTHRTTFALDEATAKRLKHLAATWQVSQAEVVRRAVALAEQSIPTEPDVASLLDTLHTSGHSLVREDAEQYLTEARADRSRWRSSE